MKVQIPLRHGSYKHVMIAWNPGTDQAASGPCPDYTGWSKPYRMTGGACYLDVCRMTPDVAKLYLVNLFNTMVIRDQVDPVAAHKALCGVTEFRLAINTECPGAIE